MANSGMDPDSWQSDLLRRHLEDPTCRSLVCCSRQLGKSQVAACLALNEALFRPPALALIVSRSLRQSSEVLRKVKALHAAYLGGAPARPGEAWKPLPFRRWQEAELRSLLAEADPAAAVRDSVLSVEFANGSRVISLPGKADSTVGFSAVQLLILDEAARVPDDTYRSMSPTRAVSRGGLVALSTPFGKRGWFWEAWQRCEEAQRHGLPEPWHRVRVAARECDRISPEFLEEERASIGERWYRQEYECSFEDTIDAVFAYADIHACLVEGEAADYG